MCLVVYLGIFDLIINGYVDLVVCVVLLFECIVVVVVESLNKGKGLGFILQECILLVCFVLVDLFNVEVCGFDCLLVQFVEQIGVGVIICGLCVVFDFEYEFQLVSMNCYLIFQIEMLFFILVEQYSFIFFLLV